MLRLICLSFLFFSCALVPNSNDYLSEEYAEGFAHDTLVKVAENEYLPIAELPHLSKVLSYDFEKQEVASGTVTAHGIICASRFLEISLASGEQLYLAGESQLYSFFDETWIQAHEVKCALWDVGIEVIDVKYVDYEQLQDSHFITVEPHHNFFVTKDDILVHNWAVTLPIISWSGSTGLKLFGAVVAGSNPLTILAGVVLAVATQFVVSKVIDELNKYQDPREQFSPEGGLGGITPATFFPELGGSHIHALSLEQVDSKSRKSIPILPDYSSASISLDNPGDRFPSSCGTPIPEATIEKQEGCYQPTKIENKIYLPPKMGKALMPVKYTPVSVGPKAVGYPRNAYAQRNAKVLERNEEIRGNYTTVASPTEDIDNTGCFEPVKVDPIICQIIPEKQSFGVNLSDEQSGCPASGPIGRKHRDEEFFMRNKPEVINGREYSRHAVDRMQARGIPLSIVENAIENGKSIYDVNTKEYSHFDRENNVKVITSEVGKVITVTYYNPRKNKYRHIAELKE